MAKKPVQKLKKKRQTKKPQKLPVAVQALLKYLGGTNVAVGSSGSQPAIIAPQLVQPPPQPAPQQPARRKRNIGTVIASSPLAQLAPPPPIPVQAQPKLDEKVIAKETLRQQSKQKEKEEATKRVEKLEGQIGGFTKQAGIVVTQLRSLEASVRKNIQDENILDDEIPLGVRPLLDEPELNVSSVKSVTRAISAPPRILALELDPGQGEAQAKQYISNVTNPEMTKEIKLKGKPGRKPLTDEQRQARVLAKKSKGETFLSEGASTISSLEALTASLAPRGKTPAKPVLRQNLLEKLVGLDPSTQIQQLTSQSARGGSAKSSQSQGQSILDLSVGKKKK